MKFYTFIISFLLLLAINGSNAQRTTKRLDSLVANYVDRLYRSGVDSICIYQSYCIGCTYRRNRLDTCFSNIPAIYFFWTNQGRQYMTLLDECYYYSTFEIQDKTLWNDIGKNILTFQNEEVKPDQTSDMIDGKTVTQTSWIDHSTFQFIHIIINQKTVVDISLDDYVFRPKVDDSHININVEHNSNTAIRKLELTISHIINNVGQIKVVGNTKL